MGDPCGMEDPNLVNPEEITEILRSTRIFNPGRTACAPYSDIDVGPTKVWLLVNRNAEDVRPKFELAFGK